MKKLLFAAIAIMAVFATSCSNTDDMLVASQDAQGTNATRSVGVKTPKLTTYIETNDINPLNMGEYTFAGTDEQVVDHVILFASNIRGTVSTVELYHNPNQTHILNNRNTLVKPLQDKGIKVLLGLLGDHTGVGFANLTSAQITSFANQVADCIEANGLDGVDFDDESDLDDFTLRLFVEQEILEEECSVEADAKDFPADMAEFLDNIAQAHSFLDMEGDFTVEYQGEKVSFKFASEAGADYCDFEEIEEA